MSAGGASAPGSYFDVLRDRLVEAAASTRRRRARRPSRLLVAATAVLLLGGTGMFLSASPEPASATVEVRRAGDRIELRLVGDHIDPEQLERAIRRAGLRVSVSRRPVGPSLVDRLVSADADRPLPSTFARLDEKTGTFRAFSLPVSWPGTLRLGLGRPARGGERYAKTSDAFAPGEPLACRDIRGRPLSEAAALLDEEPSIRLVWELQSPGGVRRTTPEQSPGATVLGAQAVSRSEIIVSVVEGGAPVPPSRTDCQRGG